MIPVILTLPIPPSINNARKIDRGRLRDTQETKDWKAYAGRELRSQHPGKLHSPSGVLIVVNLDRAIRGEGQTLREDCDNRVKLLFDLLVREDVIEDDSMIAGFAVAWAPPHSRVCRLAIMPARDLTITFHPAKDFAATGGWIIPAAFPTEEAA